MSKYVLAIGELLIDGITTQPVNNLSEARGLEIYPGGSTGNFCRYLLRCGTPVHIVASVGQDGLGRILIDKIANEGIDTRYILQKEGKNTSFIVVAKTSNTPDFIAYRDADKYILPIATALVEAASIVHTTAFALSSEPARSNILQALSQAHHTKIPVSIDWNYAVQIWGNSNEGQQIFEQVQSFKPYFKFSLDDVERFTGFFSISDATNFLDQVQASAICLTCGSKGVYYKAEGMENWGYIPAKRITVKNATGAGDAFWAGFISAVNAGLPVKNAVEKGCNIAALKLEGKWHELVTSNH